MAALHKMIVWVATKQEMYMYSLIARMEQVFVEALATNIVATGVR
jgi:hypothetical protein